MCVQAEGLLRYAFVDGLNVPDSRLKPPSYNAAPSQLLYVIRESTRAVARSAALGP